MSPEQNDILSLIAASIFADKRVYASEIDAFVKASADLAALNDLTPKLSEARLLSWYEQNKDDIRSKIATPYFKDWFYDLLGRLSHVDDKRSILNAMQTISLADGTIHVSERALITLAKRHWNMS